MTATLYIIAIPLFVTVVILGAALLVVFVAHVLSVPLPDPDELPGRKR